MQSAASEGTEVPVRTGYVTSPDGTRLAWRRYGELDGRPLVVCHGSLSTGQDWVRFARVVASERPVYVYDRRGHGGSPCDDKAFDVDVEVEDLNAVMGIAGPDADLLGHSFGGGCALAYSVRAGFANTLVLYEPRHSMVAPVSGGAGPALVRLLDAGNREGAVEHVITKIAGLPDEVVPAFRALPAWTVMCDTVHTFPRELSLLDSLTWPSSVLEALDCPTIVLVGETSPLETDDPAWNDPILRAMPRATRAVIPGGGHFSFLSAPETLAETLQTHLDAEGH